MNGGAPLLLVDDSRLEADLALRAFRRARLAGPVHVMHSGQAALDYLFGRGAFADRARHPLPRLVVLDLKMPGLDGFEVLRQVKAAPGLRRVPVIVLTSSREASDKARAYDYGANSYLVKPVAFADLVDLAGQIAAYWLALNVLAPVPE